MTAAAAASGRSRLWLFFLRAAPVRAAGFISAVVAFVLMAALMSLQAMQMSGAQEADAAVGSADFSVATSTSVLLGASGQSLDEALKAAITDAGGRQPRVQYSVLDGIMLQGDSSATVNLEESTWGENTFPESFTLSEGAWPSGRKEVAVSAPLAVQFPVGSAVELFDGQWVGNVVGVVDEQFSRNASTVFVHEGMWNSLASMPGADRYENAASRTLYWNGGEPPAILETVAAALAGDENAPPVELLAQQLQSRDDLTSRGNATLIEFRLASLLGPFLAALTGVLLATRFINRIRAVMLSIGIARTKTRASALVAVAAALGIGLAVGSGVGVGLGYAVRPLLDLTSERALGPVHDLVPMFAGLAGATLIGAALGIALNALRQSVGVRQRVAQNRLPAHYVVLPVLSMALIAGGYLSAQAAQSVDQIIVSGICFAAGGVALLPLVLELLIVRDPAHLPSLLAIRRLRADSRQAGWITAAVAGLLVVGFATSTLMTSAVASLNASNSATVPPGQIHLMIPEGASSGLEQEVTDYLGMPSLTFHIADGGVTIMDGVTLVVEDINDLEALTKVELSREQRELLDSGGTVRTKTPEITEVTLELTDGRTLTLSALTNAALTANYRAYDGFILRATAVANDIPLTAKTRAFLDPTSEQVQRAEGAATELGFNADWLAVNKPPDAFDEQLEARLAATVISILAVSVLVFFVASATRLLRPNLATLRAVGVGPKWLSLDPPMGRLAELAS